VLYAKSGLQNSAALPITFYELSGGYGPAICILEKKFSFLEKKETQLQVRSAGRSRGGKTSQRPAPPEARELNAAAPAPMLAKGRGCATPEAPRWQCRQPTAARSMDDNTRGEKAATGASNFKRHRCGM
jgi:hypothetical protein